MEKQECYEFFQKKGNSGIKPISSSFKKRFPELYDDLLSYEEDHHWVKLLPFSSRLYCFFNELEEWPKCKNCEKLTKFKQFSFGFFDFCSVKCSANYEETRKKCEKTCTEKYGHRNIAHGVLKEKIQETFKTKFGGHPFLSEEVKDKIKKNWQERYGGHPFSSKKVRDKIKETWLKKYGVDNPMKIEGLPEKTLQTKYERGIFIDWKKRPELLEDFFWYKRAVSYFTERNYRKYFYEINPNKYRRSKNGWHLDHIYPIVEGWKNKIDPVLISDKKNLQMLWCKENQGKSGWTKLSIEDFYQLLNESK